MNNLVFRYTIFYVESVSDTLSFYEAAFGFKKKMLHESGDYGELETGNTTLSFSSLELMSSIGKSPGRADKTKPTFEIAFVTDDVPASIAKAVAAGATLIQDAEEMPWGQTTGYVSDNNGFLVELCTVVSDQS